MTSPRKGGRPPVPPEQHYARVAVTLPPETLATLDEIAEQRGETRSSMVAWLVRRESERAK